MMNIVLIDDEQLAIDVLEIILGDIEEATIVATYTDAKRALVELVTIDVDVVFLDMEMGDIHGLEFAEDLMLKFPRVEVVFVTAHSQYAVEAFEVNAMDYLLKPVKIERLKKTMGKLQQKLKRYQQNEVVTSVQEQPLIAQTMGNFQLFDRTNREVKWRTRKVKELFIYLWHHREDATHRTRIMDELWGELPDEKAATLMHTTVYQLRKGLKGIGIANPISLVNEKYVLNVTVESDFTELENILQSVEMTQYTIEKVIDLYQRDYLEEENYHWILPAQQRTKQSFLQYLEKYVASVKYDKQQSYYIERCLDKMIQMEPYAEEYIYALLEHYGEVRKTEKMIVLYHEFKNRWIEELGIDMPREIIGVYTKYISR